MKYHNKYNDIPKIAKWKAIILDYGVDLLRDDMFNTYPKIQEYKVKHRIKIPRVDNFILSDSSKDESYIPEEILITDGKKKSLLKLNYRKGSPIILGVKDNIIYISDRGSGKKISLNINLVPRRKYERIKLPSKLDNKQYFLKDYVQVVGLDRIAILAFAGCWHWNTKKSCLFCDSNPQRPDQQSAIPTLNSLPEYNFKIDKWWNDVKGEYLKGIDYTFKEILKNEDIKPHKHFQLMAGNLPDTEKVWKICSDIAAGVNKVYPIVELDSYLNIAAPTKNHEKHLWEAKHKMGFNNISFNLEVIGKERFLEVCPGKARLMGYENTLKTMELAVKEFGRGNVRSNFVLGAQPVEELLDGIRELSKKGIVSDYSIFSPKRGTPWENKNAPDMDTIVMFTKELAKIYKENNFQSIYCGLSSRSNILYEILNY